MSRAREECIGEAEFTLEFQPMTTSFNCIGFVFRGTDAVYVFHFKQPFFLTRRGFSMVRGPPGIPRRD